MSAHCQRGDVPAREWEGWSLSLEALTEPVPGSEPPGLLGRTWQQSGSASWQGGGQGRCGAACVWAEPEPCLLSFWVSRGDGGPSLSLPQTAPGCPAVGWPGSGHRDPPLPFLACDCCAQVSPPLSRVLMRGHPTPLVCGQKNPRDPAEFRQVWPRLTWLSICDCRQPRGTMGIWGALAEAGRE